MKDKQNSLKFSFAGWKEFTKKTHNFAKYLNIFHIDPICLEVTRIEQIQIKVTPVERPFIKETSLEEIQKFETRMKENLVEITLLSDVYMRLRLKK